MSLSFLSKKSWHTTNLQNVEKVWLAEQAEKKEAEKLDQWKKEREEERQIEQRQRQAERDEAQRASDLLRFIDEIRQGGLVVDDDLLSSIAKELDDEDDEDEDELSLIHI